MRTRESNKELLDQIRGLCHKKKLEEDKLNKSFKNLINETRVLERLKKEAEVFNKDKRLVNL